MAKQVRGTALLGSAALFLWTAGLTSWAQNAAPGNSTHPVQPAAQPKPADDNAFPEAESKAAEKQSSDAEKAASDGPAGTAPDSPAGTTPDSPAGTTPDSPAGTAPDSPAGTAPEPESSSRSRMKGVDLLGDHDSHSSNGAGGIVNDPKLAKEDVRIGQLYMGDGNYPGAYARFKEATQVGPGNADAVFFLAEAARKTQHLDEAATNYKLYLEADPKGKHGKEAKKALTELAGK